MLNAMKIVFYSSESGFSEVLNELKLAEEKKSKEQKEKVK
jgi:hypothetical protein